MHSGIALKRAVLAALVALICLMACADGLADTADALRASRYFDGRYTAYASAVESEDGQYLVEVYLQPLPGVARTDAITGYALWVNGERIADIPPHRQGEASPLHFDAAAALPQDITGLHVTPVYASAGEVEAEAVDLLDSAAKGSPVGTTGVVNNPNAEDRLNLRVAPASDAQSLRHYYSGVRVNILNVLPDGWYAVSIGEGSGMARGYMKGDYLATGDAAGAVQSVIPSYEAAVASWSLYSYPDEASDVVAEYGLGQAFEVLGQSSAWWQIRVGDRTGFVRADVLTQPSAEEAPVADAPEMPAAEAAEDAGEPAQTTDATATDASLRSYSSLQSIPKDFMVSASIRETAADRFAVDITVQYAAGRTNDDSIARYLLYINGVSHMEIALKETQATDDGMKATFHAETGIGGAIESLRLMPVWEKGGELASGAVDFAP